LVQDREYVENLRKRNQAITISALNGDNLHSLVEAMEERLGLVVVGSRSQPSVH
jgi:ribosome-interacting GTPase 1